MSSEARLSIGFVELYLCFALFGGGLLVIHRLRAYATIVTIVLAMVAAVLATDLFAVTAVRTLPHLQKGDEMPTIGY